jgi:hypothetical protein
MIRPNPRARAAAISVALLTAGILAARFAITAVLTRDPAGASAASAEQSLAAAAPFLVVIGILKLLAAAAQILVVRAVANAAPAATARMAALVSGIAGALLLAASGLAGLYASAVQAPQYAPLAADLDLAGLGATGVFALVLLSFEAPRLRRWHAGATLLFGLLCLVALFAPPAFFLAIPVGWAFWLGLAGRLRHR